MAVTFNPVFPWQWLVSACALVAFLGMLLRYVFSSPSARNSLFGSQAWKRAVILTGTALAAGLFALAAWNPVILQVRPGAQPHLALVLDVSQSTLSGAGSLEQLKKQIEPWLAQTITGLPAAITDEASASMIVSAASASVIDSDLALEELPGAVQKLGRRDLPVGAETDLAAGLAQARQQIEAAGGQGVVLLVTDGNQTSGDALAAARQLAQAGIPIHVLPLSGGASSVYLASADLPVQIAAREETHLRGVIWNQLDTDMLAALEVKINAGSLEPGSRGEKVVLQTEVNLPANGWSRLNIPLTFEGAGLQFVDLQLKIQEAGRENIIRRRFFIYVLEPPRILAIGGDNRWVGRYAPDELIVDLADAAELGPKTIFEDYDAVVVNGVEAKTFADGLLDNLAQAVTKDGVGLLFVNGTHAPRTEEEPTVFSGYAGTAIEPILPVSVKPREETQEPPARNIIIIMDVSGSMEGGKLETSKNIANFLVQQYLRPQDRLDLITFTTDAQHLVQSLPMTAAGKQQANGVINNIPVGGGTDPTLALEIISGLKVSNCGLIFLSDGEFSPVAVRPECRGTVFDIGQDYVDPNFPLDFADPIPTPLYYEPANIVVPYFEPEVRKKFFEAGNFQPLRTPNANPLAASLAFPEKLRLDGSAVTYIKAGADLIAVRPKLTDPILAFLATEEGTVGAFTSEFAPTWFEDATGRAAFREWILQTVAYNARDRYIFQVTDLGKNLRLCVSVISDGVTPLQISGLSAALRIDGSDTAIPMSAEMSPGQFCGIAQLAEREATLKATLVLAENGFDALRKKQRIPILIPSSGTAGQAPASEAYSFGVNERLLRSLSAEGGGKYDPPAGMALFAPRTEQTRANPLWPWLLLAGSCFYLAAIVARQLNY